MTRMAHLRPCDGCLRHVRGDDTRCPFCDAALSIAPISVATLPRLSRAAQVAFVATVIVGCREETKPPSDPTTTTQDASSIEPVVPIAPPAETAAAPPPPAYDAGPPVYQPPPPNLKKPYGAPPADGFFT
jgi:hypothetical protein